MYPLVTVLIIIACVLLMIVVLVQNPKGGGLGQSFGGLSNQFLGVQRTTDFLEKSTWFLIAFIAVMSVTTLFFSTTTTATQTGPKSALENVDLGGQGVPGNNNAAPVAVPDTSGK